MQYDKMICLIFNLKDKLVPNETDLVTEGKHVISVLKTPDYGNPAGNRRREAAELGPGKGKPHLLCSSSPLL